MSFGIVSRPFKSAAASLADRAAEAECDDADERAESVVDERAEPSDDAPPLLLSEVAEDAADTEDRPRLPLECCLVEAAEERPEDAGDGGSETRERCGDAGTEDAAPAERFDSPAGSEA